MFDSDVTIESYNDMLALITAGLNNLHDIDTASTLIYSTPLSRIGSLVWTLVELNVRQVEAMSSVLNVSTDVVWQDYLKAIHADIERYRQELKPPDNPFET